MNFIHRAKWVFDSPNPDFLRSIEDGALAIDSKGKILQSAKFEEVKRKFPQAQIKDYGENSVITPGFIDCHVHAPQFEMMASAGYSLLEWLENHAFPTEAKYSDDDYANARWGEFCQGLLRCGTTYAAIYSTSHTKATEKLLKTADKMGLRAHVGKILMDRNAPQELLQNPLEALYDLENLISKWKDHDRVRPAITIRFAPTSTPDLLKATGELCQKYPTLLLQTHLSETIEEVKWVKELFPKYKSYTSVYEENGLIGERSLLAHCLYLESSEVELLKKSHLVHCPSSNLFLGSGLFPYQKIKSQGLSIAMGSDVGAGWDLSLQSTVRCCYESQALQKTFLKPSELLYLITRAGAKALGNENNLGMFEEGYLGDFVVHNLKGRGLVYERSKRSESPEDLLSALLFLGGESTVHATYIGGHCQYEKVKNE